MLALLEGTGDEHNVGAKIFSKEHAVEIFTAMRFNDETLIDIFQTMRRPGGKKLTDAQWQALLRTERRAEQSVDIAGWEPRFSGTESTYSSSTQLCASMMRF